METVCSGSDFCRSRCLFTGEAQAKKASSAEEGDSASGADDLLTTTDLSRCMADSSMLKCALC